MLFSVQTRFSYIGNLSPSDCIIQVRKHCKKQHADVGAYPMDEDTIAMLNAPNNALIGQFLHQHPMGSSYGSKQDTNKMSIIVKTTS